MPDKIFVFDAVVLCNFALADGLNLLSQRYQRRAVITGEVLGEIAAGISKGYAVLQGIIDELAKGSFLEAPLSLPDRALHIQLLATLGSGEASCLAYATNRNGIVVTDDRRARQACAERSILFTGTIGILKAIVADRDLTTDDADATLQTMISNGFYSPIRRMGDVT